MTEPMNNPQQATVPPPEKRKSARCGCALQAALVHGERIVYNPGWPAKVVDISKDGIAMLIAGQFPVWTSLTVKLYNTRQKALPPIQVRIVRTAQQANGTQVVGAAFLQPITSEQLQFLLS
jgi:hypothetical protein